MIVPDLQSLWQPEWAARAVDRCLASAGFSTATYGTSRWLAKDPAGERIVLWRTGSGGIGTNAIVERLTVQAARRYAALDLQLSDRLNMADAQAMIEAAWSFVDRVPMLAQTVGAFARSIHILDAPAPGYDVSHSDPELPCSIFLSLPIGEPFGALRLAEAVVHEVMHLQLTLIETAIPLVEQDCAATGFSPWQQRDRPLLGLVHGLFVFASVDRFMALLVDSGLTAPARDFAMKRRYEVAAEIREVVGLAAAEGLTAEGRQLVVALLGNLGARALTTHHEPSR